MVGLRYCRGVSDEPEWRQAEGALAHVPAGTSVLRAGLTGAMRVLDVLLGRAPGNVQADLAAPAAIPVPPLLGDVGTPYDLLCRRPDLIAAEQRLTAISAPRGGDGGISFEASAVETAQGCGDRAGRVDKWQCRAGSGLRRAAIAAVRLRPDRYQDRRGAGCDAEALAVYRQAVLNAARDVEDALPAGGDTEVWRDGADTTRVASQATYQDDGVSLIETLDANARLLRPGAHAQADAARTPATMATFHTPGGGRS